MSDHMWRREDPFRQKRDIYWRIVFIGFLIGSAETQDREEQTSN